MAIGEGLKEVGCATVLLYEPAEWRVSYEILAVEFLDNKDVGDKFLGEDLRFLIEPIIGAPHHPNVWGAMARKMLTAWLKAFRIRLIDIAKSTSPANHAGLYPVYLVIGE
jgi:hypothetical protein